MILIVSNKWDITVDFVIAELAKRKHPFIRLNTEDIISNRVSIFLSDFRIMLSKNQQVYDLTRDVSVVWYRRPGKPFDNVQESKSPSFATQKFVNDQWAILIESLQLVSGITWINRPEKNDQMENKIHQLFLASKLGFQIPDSIVTNDLEQAKQFAGKYDDQLVAKALYAPLIEEPDQDFFVFTNKINTSDLVEEDEIRVCPTIFQQCLSPKVDYRVTVIGNMVFPVRIEYQMEQPSHIDWRTVKDQIQFTSCKLPPDLENLCRQYVKENGLIFGAIDLIEYEGEFFFVEINPNGEWGWLQKPHNIPIAEALCDTMTIYDKGIHS